LDGLTECAVFKIANQAKAHSLPENEVIETILLAPMPQKRFISMAELCRSHG